MDEKIFLVEEIKDINLEIGAANLFLQRAENQDELKVILAKGEMAHFHVTKQENQLEMSNKKNGKISREETDEIIVQIPENHHLENMSVSIGAGKLKAENITVMERLGLEVGAGKAKLKNMHVRNLAIECGVGKCHYEGVLEHDMKVHGADWHGKIVTFLLYGTVAVHIIWFHITPMVSDLLIGLCAIMMVVSVVLYIIKNTRTLRGETA